VAVSVYNKVSNKSCDMLWMCHRRKTISALREVQSLHAVLTCSPVFD
jgi:hypothetical protein